MSTRDSSRRFQPGPGWLLFFGMIAIFVFNRNSREVVKALVEQMKTHTRRASTDLDSLKATLEKRQLEAKQPAGH